MAERVLETWQVKNRQMDATDRRLILHRHGHVVEVGYERISSVEFCTWLSKKRIAFGIQPKAG